MRYKEILDRILDNLGFEQENSRTIRVIKRNLQDVIVDMFGRTETPTRTKRYNVNKLRTFTEDFQDSTFIDGFSIGDFSYDSTEKLAKLSSGTGSLYIYPIEEGMRNYSASLKAVGEIGTPAEKATGTAKIVAENGDVLASKTFEFVDDGDTVSIDQDVSVNAYNVKFEIEIDTLHADWTYIGVTSMSYKVVNNYLDFDADVYVPLEVRFEATVGGKEYVSSEMTESAWVRWTPFSWQDQRDTSDPLVSVDVTDVEDLEADAYIYKVENIDYDNTIGYYFTVLKSGDLRMYYKPDFEGAIVLHHAYLPDFEVADVNDIHVHRMMADALIHGGTYKTAYQLLMRERTKLTDQMIYAYKSIIGESKNEYRRVLKHFSGFMHKTEDGDHIKHWSFLQDSDMELDY